MGSSYNTDEDSLTGLQLTSCCGGLVPNRPRTGTGPEAVLVLWTTSLNSTVGHSVGQTTLLPPCFWRNKWHSNWERYSYLVLKRTTKCNIWIHSSITVRRHLLFENQGNLHMDWILTVLFIATKRAFFSYPIILPQILIMYIWWNFHLVPKMNVNVKLLSHVWLFATPCTVAY